MDTSFVDVLIKRAQTMLPAATMMLLECAGDASGDPALISLLAEAQQKGLRGEPLCTEPWEAVVFDDRVLLRCHGCARQKDMPQVAGVGYGATEAEARQNALYALTLPMDKPNLRRKGCLAAHRYGSGPVEAVETACVFNRAAYESVTA